MTPVLKAAANVGLFSIITIGLIAFVHDRTAERIAVNEREALLRMLGDLLPRGSYDNEILSDTLRVVDSRLGRDDAVTVYRAREGGQVTAVALAARAADAYGGAVDLLLAVSADGRLGGVRALSHKETPGLGDLIEAEKSDWILRFAGRSLADPAESRWTVKKDGGAFDQFAGATITPRAVVTAIKQALRCVRDRHREFFAPASR